MTWYSSQRRSPYNHLPGFKACRRNNLTKASHVTLQSYQTAARNNRPLEGQRPGMTLLVTCVEHGSTLQSDNWSAAKAMLGTPEAFCKECAALKARGVWFGKERTLDGTGTCAVCRQNVKMEADEGLYHHGFQLQHQTRQGRCPGTGYKPWELSPDGLVNYVEQYLKPWAEAAARKVESWKKRDPAERIEHKHTPAYGAPYSTWTTPAYELARAEARLRELRGLLSEAVAALQGWKPQKLPFGKAKPKAKRKAAS